MKLSQIVKFVAKKEVTKLFRLRFRPRRTQKNPFEKFLKTLEASLFRQWSKKPVDGKKKIDM